MSLALVEVKKSSRIVNEQRTIYIQPMQLHFHPPPLLIVEDALCRRPELLYTAFMPAP